MKQTIKTYKNFLLEREQDAPCTTVLCDGTVCIQKPVLFMSKNSQHETLSFLGYHLNENFVQLELYFEGDL